jgi:GT2 family glycosyltransferase
MDRISVIISTKNRTQDVMRCLESISIQTILPDEIIVVDSSDTEELKGELSAFHFLNTKYIRSKPGLTLQRNMGIKGSSGDIIIFLDDDVTLDKDYIKEIMYVFDRYPARVIGGVTGEIVNEEKKLPQRFFRFLNEIFAALFFLVRPGDGSFQLSGFPTVIKSGSANEITNVEFLYGCNMAFKRDVISRFKFDENLYDYAWGEDDDIAYRVSRKYQNIYTPFAKIVLNNISPSTGGGKYAVMKMTMENHYYLFKKNLPQDFKHRVAFYWSIVGLFTREAITTLKKQDGNGLRGLMSGMKSTMAGTTE